jgi:hypothetical protein
VIRKIVIFGKKLKNMPNLTTIEINKIIDFWKEGFTNSQISNLINLSEKKIMGTLNRYGYYSNRYEKIDESQLLHLCIGSYLGDGHFTKVENDQQSRLCIYQGIAQEEYFNWKCEKLKTLNLYTSVSLVNNVFRTRSKAHPFFTHT